MSRYSDIEPGRYADVEMRVEFHDYLIDSEEFAHCDLDYDENHFYDSQIEATYTVWRDCALKERNRNAEKLKDFCHLILSAYDVMDACPELNFDQAKGVLHVTKARLRGSQELHDIFKKHAYDMFVAE